MLLQESNSKRVVSNSMISRHETFETKMVASLLKDANDAKEYNLDDSGKPIITCEERFNNSDGISPHKLAAANSCNL